MLINIILMAPFTILFFVWSCFAIKDIKENGCYDMEDYSKLWITIMFALTILMFLGGVGFFSYPEAHAASVSSMKEVYTTNTELKAIHKDWGGNGEDDLRGMYIGYLNTAYYTEYAGPETAYHEKNHCKLYHWSGRDELFLYWNDDEEAVRWYTDFEMWQNENPYYLAIEPSMIRKVEFWRRATNENQ